MSSSGTEDDIRSLQRRAEQALRSAKPRDYVLRLLEQLVTAADSHSEAARFAHRHLAELRLEESPWRAALHLRHVLRQDPDDDIAHALMGLCQALMGNFRSAVAAYRRAVVLAPTNPWYNHNLGHLLDVALGSSRDALVYLQRAHRLEPSQDEVSASLAHCLGRVGAQTEALAIARALVKRNPREADLRALLAWLEEGAKPTRDGTVPGLLSAVSPAAAAARPSQATGGRGPGALPRGSRGDRGVVEIERLISQSMSRAGHGPGEIERARRIWNDYNAAAQPVLGRPTIFAAAVEYALSRVDGATVRQKDLAERYGVSLSALQTRYAAMRALLGLAPRDPRYARTADARAPDGERKK